MNKYLIGLAMLGCSAVATASSFDCLVANIFFEARGEPKAGMQAVAAVTMNRVASSKYPNDVCKVVFQPKQFSWTHQQTKGNIQKVMKGDVLHLNDSDFEAYLLAVRVAHAALKGQLKNKLKGALWYHAHYVNPKWNRKMLLQAKVGNHLFYKES